MIDDMWSIENSLYSEGFRVICGVDEAGRGPLAGPVYAAAVILPYMWQPQDLDDSKKLSPKKREYLFNLISENALAFGIGTASAEEIDSVNILNATFLAMNRAMNIVMDCISFDIAIIDGNQSAGILYPCRTYVRGDGKSACIAAASILAKVSRDRYMTDLGMKYPEYGFEKHKGYGTKQHYAAIRKYGVLPVHRKTFLKKMH